MPLRIWSAFALAAASLWLFTTASARPESPRPKEVPKEFTNSVGMKLVLLPAGKFKMGSPKGEKDRYDDEEQHDVEVTRAFYLGVYEVTQRQFKKVMGYNPSYFSADGKGVDREDANSYTDAPAGGKAEVKGLATDDFPVE